MCDSSEETIRLLREENAALQQEIARLKHTTTTTHHHQQEGCGKTKGCLTCELEQRIYERTQELEHAIDALQREIITRKQIEENLHIRDEQFRQLTDNIDQVFWIRDESKQQILYVSPAYENIWGRSCQSLYDHPESFAESIHPDDLAYVIEAIKIYQQTGHFDEEYRIVRPDSTIRWIRARAFPIEGDVWRYAGIAEDITQRKMAEQMLQQAYRDMEQQVQKRTRELKQANESLQQEIAERVQIEKDLRNSEETLRALINAIPESVFLMSTDGVILQANQTMSSRLGKQQHEIIGASVYDLLPPKVAEHRIRYVDQAMKTGQTVRFEDMRAGIYLDHTIYPITNECGTITRLAISGFDITKHKQAEQDIKHARDAAEAANRAKSTFLANMSHELRTPLNAILGFAQLLKRQTMLSANDQHKIDIIYRSGEHLLALINSVLDLSKIEAGHMVLDNKPFELARIPEDLKTMFDVRVKQKNLLFQITKSSRVPSYVHGDEVRLRQVLINLISNAIKFTNEGGVTLNIDSSVWNSEDRQTPYNDSSPQTSPHVTLSFRIEDTGPGISHSEIPMVFEAFVQTQTGHKSLEGTGLGLTISQRLVALMGGHITIESTLHVGTTFVVEIPLRLAEEQEVKSTRSCQQVVGIAPGQSVWRILIVDDQWESREVMMSLLHPLGFDVREATDGHEAVDAWNLWKPHLIWMDMRMPRLDGYGATQQIKRLDINKETRIIALTASSFEEDRTEILKSGCDGFVRKPFREEEIFDMLHTHLGVQFAYDSIASQEDLGEPAQDEEYIHANEPCTAAMLAELSPDLLSYLRQAVIETDPGKIQQVIAQIPSAHSAVATGIAQLVDDFDYITLRTLIGEASGSS